MGFEFTSLNECEYCGQALDSSDDECSNCSEDDRVEAMFKRIGGSEMVSIDAALTARSAFLWEELARSLDDDTPLAYQFVGTRETIETKLDGETGPDSVEELRAFEMPTDYRGSEDLVELSNE